MIRSMTAYAACSRQTARGVLSWELRSVNQRYLDISLRMPEEFRGLESELRTRIKSVLQRGKVEANLRFQVDPGADASELRLNSELAEALRRAYCQFSGTSPSANHPELAWLMNWPGLLISEQADAEPERAMACDLLGQALDELQQSRAQEGAAIADLLAARLDAVATEVAQVRAHLPAIRQAMDQRFRERLAALAAPVEPGRIEQELVLYLQKLDVDEELDRIDTHVAEVRRVLALDEAVGRRLDFLMQELNREANTLGAKAAVVETGQSAVELKVLIEQMREQVQNVE